MALHTVLLRPVVALLAEEGVPDAEAHAVLVQGLLNAGVQSVTHGADPGATAAMICGLLREGLPTASI